MLTKKVSPKHAVFFALAAVSAVPFVAACGGSNSNAQGTYPNNGAPMAGQCPPGAAPGYPGCSAAPGYGAPGAQPAYGQPGAQPAYGQPGVQPTPGQPGPYPTAAPTSAPTAAPTAAPASSPVDMVIQGLGRMQAPNMQPEGARQDLQVAAGASASASYQLQGGKCYTIIAVGQGVTAYDLALSLPLMPAPVQTSTTNQPNGALGPGGGAICPLTPLPIPYQLRVNAKTGSGTVSVQLFSRIK
jgi:hypothetical protein